MGHSNEKILQELNSYLNKEKISQLYKSNIVRYRGNTKDTKEKYFEIISEILLKNIDIFNFISTISRQSSYHISSHNGIIKNPKSNRVEEKIALNL